MSQTSPLPLSESTEQRRDSVGRQAWVQKLVGSTAVDKLFNLSGLFSHLGHGNSRPPPLIGSERWENQMRSYM